MKKKLNERIADQYKKIEKYGVRSNKKLFESHKYFNSLIASFGDNVYAAGFGLTEKEKVVHVPHEKRVDGFFGVGGERGAIISEMKFPVSSFQKNENNSYGNDIDSNALLYPLYGYVSLSVYEMPRFIPNISQDTITSFSPVDTFLKKRYEIHKNGELPNIGIPIEFFSIFWSGSINKEYFIGKELNEYIHFMANLTDFEFCDDLEHFSKGLLIVNDFDKLHKEVSNTFKNIRDIVKNFKIKNY